MDKFFLLPPIIGEVTDSKVKILVEVEHDVEYTVSLNDEIVEVGSLTAATDSIKSVIIKDLRPNQRYTVQWHDVIDHKLVYAHQFKTLTSDGPKTIVTLSCDLPEMNQGLSLWERIPEIDPDLVLHLGDNVYMDGTYRQAQIILQLGLNEDAKDLVRQKYRSVWGRREALNVWSNYNNLCIWDDHEISNEYPRTIRDSDKSVYKLVTDTYASYQEGLRLDESVINASIDEQSSPSQAAVSEVSPDGSDEELEVEVDVDTHNTYKYRGYTRQWGDLLMIVTEFISLKQRSDFVKYRWPSIMEEIRRSGARRLIIVSPKALLPMSSGFWSRFIEPQFSAEDLTTVYNDLFDWMTEDKVHTKSYREKRHVLLIMGDLHIGARGVITREYDFMHVNIHFMLSTPITNWPFIYESNCVRAMRSSTREIADWTVQYDVLTSRRNFGMVHVTDEGFETELILGSGRRPPIMNLLRGLGRLSCC